MASTLDISLGARGSMLEIGRELVVPLGRDGIDVLMESNPRLHGVGQLWGGVARMGLTLGGLRYGIGLGFVGAANLAFDHKPLRDGIHAEPGGLWGALGEGYLGYIFGDADNVRAFIEARGALTILETIVAVHSDELGSLGSATLNAYLPSFELRAGARFPIDNWLFVEAGVGVSPFPAAMVPERGSVFLSAGLPIPTRNAFGW